MVCSFLHKVKPACLRSATLEIARPIAEVLLGVSRAKEDVNAALRDGTTHFLPLTAGVELPSLIASIVCTLADAGATSFTVSAPEIRDTISYFLMCVFGCDSTSRIGACYASNFQRLLYNVAACTVAHYGRLSPSMCPERLNSRTASLRRAACLVAHFADALKGWLPVSNWLDGWTCWHALAYTLEMTNETIVEINNPDVRNLSFLAFCDEIFKNVLREREVADTCPDVADLKTSFGWCACSHHFEYVLRCCTEPHLKQLLPNAWLMSTLVHHAFNAPTVGEACTRPSSPDARSDRPTVYSSPHAGTQDRYAKRIKDCDESAGNTPKRRRVLMIT